MQEKINYTITTWGERDNELIQKYSFARFVAFGELYGFDTTIYKAGLLEKDHRKETSFIIATNKAAEVVGGAAIYFKYEGSNDFRLPAFNLLKKKSNQEFLDQCLKHKKIKVGLDYQQTSMAEIGGVFRKKEYKGIGINEAIYGLAYNHMDKMGIELVFIELTKKNQNAVPIFVLNQENWAGYKLLDMEEKTGLDKKDKSLVMMVNSSLIKKQPLLEDLLTKLSKKNQISPISRVIDLKKIYRAFSPRENER
jgi:hypothetical protein